GHHNDIVGIDNLLHRDDIAGLRGDVHRDHSFATSARQTEVVDLTPLAVTVLADDQQIAVTPLHGNHVDHAVAFAKRDAAHSGSSTSHVAHIGLAEAHRHPLVGSDH